MTASYRTLLVYFTSLILIFININTALAAKEGRLLDNNYGDIRDPENGEFLYLPDFPTHGILKVDQRSAIAIVDSGLAIDHPQLKDYIVDEIDFTGEGPYDHLGHGTIVALIFIRSTGASAGALPELEKIKTGVINVKVANKYGKIKKKAIIEAIEWIGKRKIKIANLSIGFEGNENEHSDLCNAIQEQKDVIFIAAAGNSGPNVSNYPAACNVPNIISVGATNNEEIAQYSGQGDIYAPGSVSFIKKSYVLYNKGNTLSKQGSYKQALVTYNQALEIEAMPEAHFQKGIIFLNKQLHKKAYVEFKSAIKINPDFPEANEYLGLLYYFDKEYIKAIQYLERAAYLAPNNQRIQNNYKSVLSEITASNTNK